MNHNQELIRKVLYAFSIDLKQVEELDRYNYSVTEHDLAGLSQKLWRVSKKYHEKGMTALTDEVYRREGINVSDVNQYFNGLREEEVKNVPLYVEELTSVKALHTLKNMQHVLSGVNDNMSLSQVENLITHTKHEMMGLKGIKKTKQAKTFYDLHTEFTRLDGDKTYIPTGIKEIDKVIKGFYLRDITLLTGLSNQGKTTTAIQFMANMLKQGKKVAFFNAELTEMEVYGKVMGLFTGSGYQRHNKSNYIESSEESVNRHKKASEEAFYYIDKYIQSNLLVKCGGFNESELIEEILECERLGVDIIFVDYFQLIDPSDIEEETKAAAYKNMAERVRSIVKTQTNVAFVWLAQLKEVKNESPMQHDIAWCKDLYKGAGLELRVYREYDDVELQTFMPTIFIGFKKTRFSDRPAPIECAFVGETGRIDNFSMESIEDIKNEYVMKGQMFNFEAYLEGGYETDNYIQSQLGHLTKEEREEREMQEQQRQLQEDLESIWGDIQ